LSFQDEGLSRLIFGNSNGRTIRFDRHQPHQQKPMYPSGVGDWN